MKFQDLKNGRFYNECCFDAMKDIPDNVIDMILCDLPYGTTACSWDAVIPFEPLWREYRRLIRGNGAIVLTASQPFTTALIASNLPMFKYEWIWEKSVAGDCMNAKNKPMKKHENVTVFSRGTTANKSERRMTYHPQGLRETNRMRSGVDYGATGGSFKTPRPSHGAYVQTLTGYPTSILKFNNDPNKLHPTQKPVELFEYFIKTYTNENDLILDNCAGSGTTAIAAINTNRKWICIEKEEDYANKAVERIKNHAT